MRRALALAALLAGCNTGTVELHVADAPVDGASAVVVEFDAVEFLGEDDTTQLIELAPPVAVNLLDFANGDSFRLVDGTRLERGTYRGVRLGVNATGSGADSYVEEGSTRRGLLLASGDEGRLRIETAFELERDDELTLIVDFDLRKSVRNPADPSQPYELVPALRLVEEDAVGTLAGTVDGALTPSGCVPAVYLYAGHGVTPDDEGSLTPPYASGLVRDQEYTIAWLPPGSYTAALTCEADLDDPEANDDVAFTDPTDVTVRAGETTLEAFP